jgi:AhpD family alkylhydroperoxidase
MKDIEEMGEKELQEVTDRILAQIERIYGKVPLVSEELSRRPDVFIPYTRLSKAILYKGKALDERTRELVAIGASTALGGEHCLNVHVPQALRCGATAEEVFEAMLVGSMMAMTNTQAISMRRFRDLVERNEIKE